MRDPFQFPDALADGDPELMCVDDPGEGLTALLAAHRPSNQVVVATEEHAPRGRRTIRKLGIGQTARAVLARRQHVDPAPAATVGHPAADVVIHVEFQAHAYLPIARRSSISL